MKKSGEIRFKGKPVKLGGSYFVLVPMHWIKTELIIPNKEYEIILTNPKG